SLVTLAAIPYVPDRLPSPVFRVSYIQEVHWMVKYDRLAGEPKAVGVRIWDDRANAMPVDYPPCRLRPLNHEELQLARLRNQAPEDSGEPAGIVDTQGNPVSNE